MQRSSQLIFDFFADRKAEKKLTPPETPPPPAAAPAPVTKGVSSAARPENASPMLKKQDETDEKMTALVKQWSRDLKLPKLASSVHVRWNPRLKTTAGTACPRTSAIDLNCKLTEFGEDVVMRILKHELAHLVAHTRAGRRRIAAHGMEWRQACTDLGIPGEKSRHTLPFQSNPQRRKFAYQCPNCEDVVLRVRKFSRYSACWLCCKKYNRGQYSERFQLQQIPLEKGVLISRLREHMEAPSE